MAGIISGTAWALVMAAFRGFQFPDPQVGSRLVVSSIFIALAFGAIGTFTNWLRDLDYFE